MQEEIISGISEGFEVDGRWIYGKNPAPCKLKGALSLDVYLQERSEERHLLRLTAYCGRMPYYRPWIELYCINSSLDFSSAFEYYNSDVEDALLSELSRSLGPGGKIFIEYYNDPETSRGLAFGCPPAVTRQGCKLFDAGFTWFKDWYFSEGGHEGGQKLQGEMPLNDSARRLQMERLRREIEAFLDLNAPSNGALQSSAGQRYHQEAKERAGRVLQGLKSAQAKSLDEHN